MEYLDCNTEKEKMDSLDIIHMNLMQFIFTIFLFQGDEEYVVKEKEQEKFLMHYKMFTKQDIAKSSSPSAKIFHFGLS